MFAGLEVSPNFSHHGGESGPGAGVGDNALPGVVAVFLGRGRLSDLSRPQADSVIQPLATLAGRELAANFEQLGLGRFHGNKIGAAAGSGQG